MFSSEANTSEAASLGSSHLRSWQPTVVSEQQTHFSITPLSLFLPVCSFHLTLFLCSLISSFVFSPLSTSPILSPRLSHLRSPFLHCMILLSAVHPDWIRCQLLLFFCYIFHLPLFSDSLVSPSPLVSTSHLTATSTFHCLQLKIVFATEVTGGEYS